MNNDAAKRLREWQRELERARVIERRATVERIRAAVRDIGWDLDSPWLADILDKAEESEADVT